MCTYFETGVENGGVKEIVTEPCDAYLGQLEFNKYLQAENKRLKEALEVANRRIQMFREKLGYED